MTSNNTTVMERVDVDEKRRVAAAKRARREARREKVRHQRRCFWTRPLGHAWEYGKRTPYRTCAGCGKEAWAGD